MKKAVTIRLEEEFIKKIKIICIQQNITFQDAVSKGLDLWKDEVMSHK